MFTHTYYPHMFARNWVTKLPVSLRLGKLDCVSIVRNSLAFAVIFGMKR